MSRINEGTRNYTQDSEHCFSKCDPAQPAPESYSY